jgi:hypothetical protein
MPEQSNLDSSSGGTRIRFSYRLILYAGAWLLALFATDPSVKFWALAYLFPLGLAAFVNLRLGNDGGWGVLGVCAAVYLVHAWFYFRSKTVRSTVILFTVLVILLICNVSGCRAQLPRH